MARKADGKKAARKAARTLKNDRPGNPRQGLSADALFAIVRERFEKLPDHRPADAEVSLPDALMSAFAMFSLKDPSLLAFDQRRNDENLKSVYHIENIPCDTHLRTILDLLDPELLRPLFRDVFRQLQRGKALEPFVFYEGCYLLSLDGTGYFSSGNIHCPSCLQKTSKSGKVTYHHQMLGAAIVHPDIKEVIPLMPEPIIKQDGETKNDCERNAAKRFLHKLRQDHPHLGLIVIEDALSSNAPHIRELQDYNLHYILGVKQAALSDKTSITGLYKKRLFHHAAVEKQIAQWESQGWRIRYVVGNVPNSGRSGANGWRLGCTRAIAGGCRY